MAIKVGLALMDMWMEEYLMDMCMVESLIDMCMENSLIGCRGNRNA